MRFAKAIITITAIGMLFAYVSGFADLQAQLARFHSLSASFTDTLTGQQGNTQTSAGKVWIQKPNRFRWQVETPNKQLFVSDGKQLWNYEEDLQQVTVHPLDAQLSQTPLLLLSGKVANVNKLFTVVDLGSQRYQLTPKQQGGLIKQILLQFVGNKLRQLRLINTMGQVSTIHFTHVEINTPLPATLFQFTPPKGVDVLK